LGKSTTRAGYTGSIDTDVLKGAADGFGVFAYYTGVNTYGQFQKKGASIYSDEDDKEFKFTEYIPNFMYNQHVYYDASATQHPSVSNWVYSPVKYWPNEVEQAADYGTPGVDDQNNDKDNDPAIATGGYGGNVSFFAYAPYVNVEASTGLGETGADAAFNSTPVEGVSGILALTTNEATGDPKVAYKIPASGETVDLLWGTKGNTGLNVNNEKNTGVSHTATGTEIYSDAILNNYTTNADLTKQTTTGTIDFLFKHATSKVGGSYNGNGEGDDDDPSTTTNGLMIVLDLDLDGKEAGGQLEPFAAGDAMYDATSCKYKTKVTVKTITIESKESADPDKVNIDAATGEITSIDYTTTWTKQLVNQGVFNLATGQWSNTTTTADFNTGINHIIVSPGSTNEEKNSQAATLSEEIAEKSFTAPTNLSEGQNIYKSTQPIGVTTTPKNVYEGETSPLLFLPDLYPVLHVTVEYVVRTYDANLKYGYSEVTQKIKKRLVFTKKTELNKAYNLLIHLGLTSVKFTATVSDWDSSELRETTTTDPNTGEVITLYESDEDVYNPMNVEQEVTALNVTGTPALTNNAITVASEASTILLAAAADLKSNEGVTNTGVDVTSMASYIPDVSWIHVTSAGKVTIDEYKAIQASAADTREGHINVSYGDETQTITITQNPRYVSALQIMLNNTPASEGDEVTYDIRATITDGTSYTKTQKVVHPATTDDYQDQSYYIATDAASADYASIDKANAKLVVKPNTTGSDRNITLTAKFYGKEVTRTVTQASATLAAIGATAGTNSLLNLSIDGKAQTAAAEYTVPAKGGTVSINGITAQFTSNSFTQKGTITSVSSDQTWATVSGKNIVVAPNTTSTAPTDATITVNFKDENGEAHSLDFTLKRSAITAVSALSATVNGKAYTADAAVTVPVAGVTYSISKVIATLTDGTTPFDRDAIADGKVTVTLSDISGITSVSSSGSGNATTLTFGVNNTGSAISGVTMAIKVTYETSIEKTITLTFSQAASN